MNKSESKYYNTAAKMDRAFLSILGKKDFSYITVKEVCAKAEVNRSTFYLHYDTMEDLLSESVEYMNEQFLDYMKQDTNAFMSRIRECPINELYLVTPQYLMPYLNYIRDNKNLFFTAVKNTKALRLEESYDNMFRFVFSPILERYQVSDEIRRYIMAFYVEGFMAIITQWLKNDCKDTVERIMEVMQKCTAVQMNTEI